MPVREVSDVDAAAVGTPVNEVRLVGRLAAEPEARELPSGTPITTFRLVVTRTASGRASRVDTGARTPTVDTIDCVAWRSDVRKRLQRLAGGETLEVAGALRRRFWRTGGGGPASRSEVEVVRLRRLDR
jgi:single-strand DNA-binding protein